MGRTKRAKKPKRPGNIEEDDIIEDDGPDPESDDLFHDAVDKFNLNREKLLLDTEADDSEEEDTIEEEEIIGLNLPESDDEENEDEEENGEEDESDEEAKLPSNKSWGKKKASYYNADATEQDIGSDEEAWELEKEEEIEAMALQQRMAAALDEEDFDTANYEMPHEDDTEDKEREDEEIDKTVVMDLTKLSKEQKLEILFRESPELFELLDEFKSKLEELALKVSPLVKLSKIGQLSSEGSKYIQLKYKLYLNYCVNIGFYLLLKSKQTPVKDHPVIERIVQYRNLIKELEPIDKKLESDINFLLENKDNLSERTSKATNVSKKTKKIMKAKEKHVKHPRTKLSALLSDDNETEDNGQKSTEPPVKKTKKSSSTDIEDQNPLDYYEKVRLEKKKAKEIKDLAARLAHEPDLELGDLDVNEEGKRAITYQISKNKGLTAKKKKEDRNPRVKHRRKYSKAIVKRKSQVRPVVTELTRYDGEKSGIRAFLTRSTKIK